jgi:hypothetical protein
VTASLLRRARGIRATLVLAAVIAAAALAPAPARAQASASDGLTPTIQGTAGDDALVAPRPSTTP